MLSDMSDISSMPILFRIEGWAGMRRGSDTRSVHDAEGGIEAGVAAPRGEVMVQMTKRGHFDLSAMESLRLKHTNLLSAMVIYSGMTSALRRVQATSSRRA
jgi:hypothetical protein